MTGASGLAAAREIRRLQQELERIIERMGEVRVHRAKPSVADIPLLLKALSLDDPEITADALKALRAISGVDHGLDADRWEAWWSGNRAALLRHEAHEEAALTLFAGFRRDILTGRWENLHGALARRIRTKIPPEVLSQNTRRVRRSLRRAYRDARVRDLWIGETEGALTVDWGRIVFDFSELPLVHETDGWRFARLPWSARTHRRPKQAVRRERAVATFIPLPHADSASEPHVIERSPGWNALKICVLLLLAGVGLVLVVSGYRVIAGVAVSILAALLYVSTFLPIWGRFRGLSSRLKERRARRRAARARGADAPPER